VKTIETIMRAMVYCESATHYKVNQYDENNNNNNNNNNNRGRIFFFLTHRQAVEHRVEHDQSSDRVLVVDICEDSV